MAAGVTPGRLGRLPHLVHPDGSAPRRPGPGAGSRPPGARPAGPRPRCAPRCGSGTPPGRTGLGNEWAWRNETNSPSKSAPAGPESAHRARRAAMVSSVRRPRLRGSAPVARSSSSIQPTPTHIRTLPSGQDVHGGDALGQHHRLVVGHDQHPGGQGDPLGDRGQIGHEIERVGDPAVVGQGHPARRGVGVGALVVRDHHRVLHQHHATRSRRPRRGGRTRSSRPGRR